MEKKSLLEFCDGFVNIPDDDNPINKVKKEFLKYRKEFYVLRDKEYDGIRLTEEESKRYVHLVYEHLQPLQDKLYELEEFEFVDFWAFDCEI